MKSSRALIAVIAPPALLTLAAAFLFALLPGESRPGHVFTGAPPARIISLSPSVTRMIADLGRAQSIVGVTAFDRPPHAGARFIGTYIAPDAESILGLRPDIIVISSYDAAVQNTARLGLTGVPVHSFPRVRSRADIYRGYRELASLMDRSALAEAKLAEYDLLIESAPRPAGKPRVGIFIAHEPLVAAGGGSFIDGIIRDAGCENSFGRLDAPYPIVSREYLVALRIDVVISIMEGAPEFFRGLFAQAPGPGPLKNDCIYSIDPDLICFYTPGDYARAVNDIARLSAGACSNETR
ncbi:MAG: hypothetical protein EPN93_11310 [Spirochaetes bacterium]|nr:MAG: hypothetical protein EPN93_11310 [Spirochaetota bacterium]